MKNIRNFCIIAHIDHGKSTLADRFLDITHSVEERDKKEQILDQMDLERERGITIKLAPAQMLYPYQDQEYYLNLIDTPGHVDFSYEVSRSLAAVEGAILVVDASQGIQAQTLANVYQALLHDLVIIPVINKIDLPHADKEKVTQELVDVFGFKEEEILYVSAKTGEGVEKILQTVIEKVPSPQETNEKPLRALIFDSKYDPYRGVVAYVRIMDGSLNFSEKSKLRMMQTETESEMQEIGVLTPKPKKRNSLENGQIGYIVTTLKDVAQCRVGDTLTLSKGGEYAGLSPLPGYAEPNSVVFSGFFCTDSDDYPLFKDALAKLKLSDSSLNFSPEVSPALGFGYRLGFLGMLHLEIVKERLEREFNLDLIATSPSVSYQVVKTNGEVMTVNNPTELPPIAELSEVREPWVKIELITPTDYIGSLMELCQEKRGVYLETRYLEKDRAILIYELPLSEMIIDFYDALKSRSSGYASLSYEMIGYRAGDLAKMDILVCEKVVDSISQIVPKQAVLPRGRAIVAKLKELIPRQMYEIKIQAAVGAKVIASERISPFRKDVTAKLYGGDVTRKNKLLDKQKAGKKKMKKIGQIEIPTEVFVKLLR